MNEWTNQPTGDGMYQWIWTDGEYTLYGRAEIKGDRVFFIGVVDAQWNKLDEITPRQWRKIEELPK